MAFHFVDQRGASWMVLPGLPESHPDAAIDDSFPGLTFRASTGELRVLLRPMMPSGAAGLVIPALGTAPRLRAPSVADWQALLEQTTPWPGA
jgi:hypothetical protein